MRVLVAYATAHGSTQQVAEAIAARLDAAGFDITTRAAGDVADLAVYDAAVVGSAVHNQRWLPPAAALVARLRDYPTRPLWTFSVCTIGETTSFLGPRLSRLARSRRPLPGGAAEPDARHRFFAGAIERSHWNILGRLFFAVTRGSYGDHRDWKDIDRWADMIAAHLAREDIGVSAAADRPEKMPPRWFVHTFWHVHRAVNRISGDRCLWTTSNKRGWGALRLTTLGRKSGKPRSVIVGYIEDGPNLVALAMNGWEEGHPAWWLNLRAHPEAVVRLAHRRPRRVRARLAQGDEHDRLWQRWAEVDMGLDTYADRRSVETPVVVFEPGGRVA